MLFNHISYEHDCWRYVEVFVALGGERGINRARGAGLGSRVHHIQAWTLCSDSSRARTKKQEPDCRGFSLFPCSIYKFRWNIETLHRTYASMFPRPIPLPHSLQNSIIRSEVNFFSFRVINGCSSEAMMMERTIGRQKGGVTFPQWLRWSHDKHRITTNEFKASSRLFMKASSFGYCPLPCTYQSNKFDPSKRLITCRDLRSFK